MADKVERWEKRQRATGTYVLIGVKNGEERYIGEIGRHFDIDKIVALHNAAIDINPSNPMAVAEGLRDLIKVGKLMSNLPCICSLLTNKDPHPCPPCQLRNTLAAITKPAIGKENGDAT
jgi:hypothetical protein